MTRSEIARFVVVCSVSIGVFKEESDLAVLVKTCHSEPSEVEESECFRVDISELQQNTGF